MAKKELVIESQGNGCHVCVSHLKKDKGYTRIKVDGKFRGLHQIMYENTFGEIPNGMIVRHKCDNRACVNPEHLELGTIADNNRDTRDRGRYIHAPTDGENNPMAIITEDDVRKIRADKETPNTVLGKKYNVHHSTISAIRLNKSWKHVT